ncbi:MAG: radical SAM protein [Candidatus Omnitrophica bacterium]|nr:radical SAM protein [Candidatus Omnitrophota bacterium]
MRVLLVIYDNDSFIHWFPHGMAYIASALKNAGHKVTIYNQDKFHYPETHLTQYLNSHEFDVVGVGVIAGYHQYRKLLEISEAVNLADRKPFYVLGGHGPSPEPEYFLKKTNADVVVLGEGEITIVELLDALQDKKDLHSVDGIAFLDNNKLVVTKERAPIKEIDTIPLPAWDLFPMDYYSLIREPHIRNKEKCFPVISGRGCPFNCNFCYRMDKGIRIRSSQSVIEEIQILKKDYNISYIAFMDELFMSSPVRTIKLCEDFINAKLNIKWSCNGRLNYATPEVLKVMKKAGCVFIGYGIECMDDEILKVMNKNLTVEQITKGIEATLSIGISPGFNIIFGNIGENEKTLQASVDFLLKYDDHSQLRTIRPVTPYPGSPLYYYAKEKGLLKDVEEFYEKRHINSDLLSINFTSLTDEEFYKHLFEANKKLLKNYSECKLDEHIEAFRKLYLERDVNFRGLRQT